MHLCSLKYLQIYIWNIKMELQTDEENKFILQLSYVKAICYVTIL